MKFFLKPLVATALLVVWLSANAQTEIADDLYVEDARVPAKFSTNVFIVRMKDAPVLGYEGGIGRYKATKPQKGKRIKTANSSWPISDIPWMKLIVSLPQHRQQ